ncbi:MAG: hypothetical protein ABI697_07650 [Devosia sp.]
MADRQILTPAHTPLVLLIAALVIAVILGISTGAIDEHWLKQPVPGPNDPITVP